MLDKAMSRESTPIILDRASSPKAIEERSFAIIDTEIPEPRPFSGNLWRVARRCIHTLGDTEILNDLRLSDAGAKAAVAALRSGCTVYTDTRMAAAGLPSRRMAQLGVRVLPLMALPNLEDLARQHNITRSRAGIMYIARQLAGNIIVIGNAPTALLALLEELQNGAPPPELIVGMPVGFVNAAQSKELLHRSPWAHFTLLGRKGGSAVAASCINALADIALEERAWKTRKL